MQHPLPVVTFVLAALVAGSAVPVRAELGDYTPLQTIANLFAPPGPTNPVTTADRQGPYPLKSSPSSFADGFQPGLYYQWQTIQLHPSTDAVCGNGTPYKFFVNRVPNTRNTIIYLEGGGACWDAASCRGQTGIRGARNPERHPRRLHEPDQSGRRAREPVRVPRAPVLAREDTAMEHGVRALLHGRHLRRRLGADLRGSRRRGAAARLAPQRRAQRARGARVAQEPPAAADADAGRGLQRGQHRRARRLRDDPQRHAPHARLPVRRLGPGVPGARERRPGLSIRRCRSTITSATCGASTRVRSRISRPAFRSSTRAISARCTARSRRSTRTTAWARPTSGRI